MLTVRDIRKRYTDAPLLEHASFTLWRNDRTALIGPNGCGKTTLLRVITGQLDRGRRQRRSSATLRRLVLLRPGGQQPGPAQHRAAGGVEQTTRT